MSTSRAQEGMGQKVPFMYSIDKSTGRNQSCVPNRKKKGPIFGSGQVAIVLTLCH